MPDAVGHKMDLAAMPLFPLPNVVLFPRAVLPLHIFEHRYKLMMADALAGDRQIAMALLKPGWEKDYHGKPAIEPVVCVGTILTHEMLPGGTYNLLLQGHTRAKMVHECGDRPYRLARLEPLVEQRAMEIDVEAERHRLSAAFSEGALAGSRLGKQFRQMLASTISTADIGDLVAFTFFEDVTLKQSLLAECDVRLRLQRLIEALERARLALAVSASSGSNPGRN